MIRLAADGQPLKVFGRGDQLRDYTFVDEVADAFLKAAARASDIAGRHYVVGTGHRRTIAEIVTMVARRVEARTGRKVAIEHVAAPASSEPIDARSYVVDAAALTAATGWRPGIELADGIDMTVGWLGSRA
jgi:nucleoside-diphosphate-sugar epimerase